MLVASSSFYEIVVDELFQVIEKCLSVMAPDMARSDTVIVVGSYTIGKERLFVAAAQRYNVKIYVDNHKYFGHLSRSIALFLMSCVRRFNVIQCLNYPPEVNALFVRSPAQAKIHVVSMGHLSYAST